MGAAARTAAPAPRAHRDDDVGHVALLRDDFQALHRLLVAHDVAELRRGVGRRERRGSRTVRGRCARARAAGSSSSSSSMRAPTALAHVNGPVLLDERHLELELPAAPASREPRGAPHAGRGEHARASTSRARSCTRACTCACTCASARARSRACTCTGTSASTAAASPVVVEVHATARHTTSCCLGARLGSRAGAPPAMAPAQAMRCLECERRRGPGTVARAASRAPDGPCVFPYATIATVRSSPLLLTTVGA